MLNFSQTKSNQSGFTLIEVMISLLIFATGMLGVAFQMSQGIKNTINTKVHSSVMQVALQTAEPLSRSVQLGNAAFKVALNALPSGEDGVVPPFADNTNQNGFKVSVKSVVDRDNMPLSNDIENWKAPYTVVFRITHPTAPINFFTTHVLAP